MFGKILVIGILAVTLASAQRGGGGGRGSRGMDGMGAVPMGPGNRMDIFANMLKLTKDQKKNVKSTMDEAQKEATPLHEQIVKSRDAIASAVAAGKGQEEVTPLVNAEAALETQMEAIELKAFAQIYKTLDTEQQPQVAAVFRMMKGIFNGKNWNSLE